jgi:alkylation response protein AidB-like acyl-CoA dehydrogenase
MTRSSAENGSLDSWRAPRVTRERRGGREIAGVKTPQRMTQMLRDNHGAQVRVSQAESLVRSARLFLFDSLDRLWGSVVTTGEAPMEQRAHVRFAASHAVSSALQVVDLLNIGAGANALYTSCPLERAFRDVHAITQHIGVNPRVMETTGRVFVRTGTGHATSPVILILIDGAAQPPTDR